jgi:phospholipid/cholesterol/gamma-HCH transport system permease protein
MSSLAPQPDAALDEATPAVRPSWVHGLGSRFVTLHRAGKQLYSVFVRTLLYTFSGKPEPRRVLSYMYSIGNQSLVFLCVVMGFIGMIVVYQAGLQLLRVIPDMTQLGTTYLELLVKDLAVSICALMLATRVGAGIAAEIGSMVVTEQVDALKMCATDPIDYLIRPRFVASIIMTVVLVVIAGAVAIFTGMVTADVFFGVNPATFLDFREVDAGDITIGLTKAVAYGATIPVVSGYCGLTTHGGSQGVGTATTRAVVNSSLAIIIINFILTSIGYLLFE